MLLVRTLLLSTLLIILAGTSSASAKFTITIAAAGQTPGSNGTLNLGPGSIGTLNVTIASDGTNNNLSGFSFVLQITPTNGTPTQLGFVLNQPQPYNNSQYVFAGNSLNSPPGSTTADPLGNVSTISTPNDTYSGGDYTNDGSAVAVTPNNNLLFSIQVAGNAGAAPRYGDSFLVSLLAVNPRSPAQTTSFLDANGSPVDYTVQGGTINVVPEPASALLLMLGGVLVGGVAFRRRTLAGAGV